MIITFPDKQSNIAELSIDGTPVNYRIPPITGTYSECFAESNYTNEIIRATGREIVAYVYGALVNRKNEWADQEIIKFPTQNDLRVPKVLTIIPKNGGKKFGDLEGAMIVDGDLNGEGIAMKTIIPADLTDWELSDEGIFRKNGRVVVPYDKWCKNQWDENNGAVIAIFDGKEYATSLAKIAKNSGRGKPFWKVDPVQIQRPEKMVPVVNGYADGRIGIICVNRGYSRDGCAVRILKQ